MNTPRLRRRLAPFHFSMRPLQQRLPAEAFVIKASCPTGRLLSAHAACLRKTGFMFFFSYSVDKRCDMEKEIYCGNHITGRVRTCYADIYLLDATSFHNLST